MMKIQIFNNDTSTAIILPFDLRSAVLKDLAECGFEIWGVFSSHEKSNEEIIIVLGSANAVIDCLGLNVENPPLNEPANR